MPDLIKIDYVAWWGAIVATSVFIWDIVKWMKSGPKLKMIIKPDARYKDARIISRERKADGSEEVTAALYYHIEVINRGNLPTTIMYISEEAEGLYSNEKIPIKLTTGAEAFMPHFGNKLPYILKPGEVWSCRIEKEHIMNTFKIAQPWLVLHVSHRNKPIIRKIPVGK